MRSFLGWALVALSGFFVLAAIGDLAVGTDDTPPGVLAGILVFFLVVGYGGYRLIISRPAAERPEQRVLALAQRVGGKVTLAEVVLACKLSPEEAQQTLKKMVRQGLAELHVSDGGEEVYAFAGLIPAEKASAKDPLD